MQPPEVAVDKGIASLGLVLGAVGQPKEPGGVLVPGMLVQERVLGSSAPGCTWPHSLRSTYWWESISLRAYSTPRG